MPRVIEYLGARAGVLAKMSQLALGRATFRHSPLEYSRLPSLLLSPCDLGQGSLE